jgi:hypothetical protein
MYLKEIDSIIKGGVRIIIHHQSLSSILFNSERVTSQKIIRDCFSQRKKKKKTDKTRILSAIIFFLYIL